MDIDIDNLRKTRDYDPRNERTVCAAVKRRLSVVGRWIGKVFRLPLLPISRNPLFFTFMFVLGYASFRLTLPDRKGFEPYPFAVEELFVDLYVVCALLALIPLRVRKMVRGVIYAIIYPTVIADLYCFVKLGSTLNPTMLLLVGETNSDEASEFFSSYLTADVLTSGVGVAIAIMLAHIACNVAAPYVREKVRMIGQRHNVLIDDIRKNVKRRHPYPGLVILLCFVICVILSWDNKAATARLMSYDNIGSVEHELTRKDKATLYHPVYRLWFSIYANRLTARQLDRLIETTRHLTVDSCSFRSPDIVFIIGESYNRSHSQLYGYDKPTAPRQQERMERGELTRFDDVVSSWNLTSFVFKHVFSLYTVGDSGEWCDYPLFPEVFRQAGYNVTFVTNQFLPQAKEAVYDFSGGFFLNNPVLSAAQFDARNVSLHDLDRGVLDDLDSLDSRRKEANLTIVHLKGQHSTYRERYPLSHKKWLARDYKRPRLKGRERWILSDYDNATLYNDSIVDEVIRRFEDRNAIVIYMPDHGEECFDDDIHVSGRLHSAAIDYRLAREEFEIPFWIWCSRSYAATRPDVIRRIREASSRPFMTDRVAHMLLWLGGIACPDYRSELNILSDDYDTERRRTLKNTADYDRLRDDYRKKQDGKASSNE